MDLNQVTVPSLDLERSIQFYEKLGLKLIVRSLPDYIRFECPNGNSTFSVHRVEELSVGEGVYVYFECDTLEQEVERLLKLGIQFDSMPTDQSWLWKEARLKDPDNNQLILYHAANNRKNPPWRLKD